MLLHIIHINIYEKNYKTLIRKIKEQNLWGDIPCACLGRFNIVKISLLTKLIYRFNTILIKIPESYFVDTENLILTITWTSRPRYP